MNSVIGHRSRKSRVGRRCVAGSWLALLAVVALGACGDMPRTAAAPNDARSADEVSEIAYAISAAMASESVRLGVLSAMRASPGVDHLLVLGEYVRDRRADELVRRSASALGISQTDFLSRIWNLPELEFSAPFTEHRLSWTGTAEIAVGGMWDSDTPEIRVYEPSGKSRVVGEEVALLEYEALFVVRPRESFGTRIGRQADGPGDVIQDPDDGEDAIVLMLRLGDGAARSFDFGQYESAAALRSAMADAFGTELEWVEPVSDVAHDVVCPQSTPEPCGGTGGTGSEGTYLDALILNDNLDMFGDSEIGLTLESPSSMVTWIHYDVDVGYEDVHPDYRFVPSWPIYETYYLQAEEYDLFSTTFLGTVALEWDDSDVWQDFRVCRCPPILRVLLYWPGS